MSSQWKNTKTTGSPANAEPKSVPPSRSMSATANRRKRLSGAGDRSPLVQCGPYQYHQGSRSATEFHLGLSLHGEPRGARCRPVTATAVAMFVRSRDQHRFETGGESAAERELRRTALREATFRAKGRIVIRDCRDRQRYVRDSPDRHLERRDNGVCVRLKAVRRL